MYKETCKTTKFNDFKIQEYSLSMTIQYHSDTLILFCEVAMIWLLSHGKYKCVLSYPIPRDSHRNDIPVDKPVFLIYAPNHNRFVNKVAGFYV